MLEQLKKAFSVVEDEFSKLTPENQAQFLLDCCVFMNATFEVDILDKVVFPGMNELVESGKKQRWKPSYLDISINSHYNNEFDKVFEQLSTYAREKGFDIIEGNTGIDQPDTYAEISMGLRNQWVEYQLKFDDYIDQNELLEFLKEFSEIEIGRKQYPK